MASDDAAISTNDDASQCKRYAVEKGYWMDPYISLLTGRPTNIHTPEINRGYYARVKGIRLLLEQFLRVSPSFIILHFFLSLLSFVFYFDFLMGFIFRVQFIRNFNVSFFFFCLSSSIFQWFFVKKVFFQRKKKGNKSN